MPSKRDIKGFGLGFGAAIIVGSLWPVVKKGVRPATKAVVKGAMLVSDQLKSMSAEIQGEMEDLVAEVEFERNDTPNPAEGELHL